MAASRPLFARSCPRWWCSWRAKSEREDAAGLQGENYAPVLDAAYRWQTWAAPRKDGKLDHNAAMTGDDLIAFVNLRLFPYLKKFRKRTAADADTIEYNVGEIFSEITNKFRSGYSLRDALEIVIVDMLGFNSQQAKRELSDLYETRIRRMGNAGRNRGEYYTPRPLIRAMIKVTGPKIGETIYDGACGSAGFLCEAWEHLRRDDLSASEYDTLQRRTFFGQEKKSLAYILGVMNMILHGIEAPSIRHTNTLTENVMDIEERDRHDIVLANPPFSAPTRPTASPSSRQSRSPTSSGFATAAPTKRHLGPVPSIRDAFVGIQAHLFR